MLADGYFPYHEVVALRGGETNALAFSLSSRDRHGVLAVSSALAGTSISIDDHAIGVVPTETILDQGVHKVRATHEAFSDALTQVVINAGQRKELRPRSPHPPVGRHTLVVLDHHRSRRRRRRGGRDVRRADDGAVPLPTGTFSPGALHF